MRDQQMNSENAVVPKKSSAIKMIVPIVIICVIAAIWLFKGADAEPYEDDGNPDFALYVTEEIDFDKLKSYGLPIIIDFGADSCIPCKEMAPVLKELNRELRGKAIIRFVDVWEHPDLSEGFVTIIPTQVLIDADGKPYLPGNVQLTGLRKFVSKDTEEHIYTVHQGGLTKEQMMAILAEMGLE